MRSGNKAFAAVCENLSTLREVIIGLESELRVWQAAARKEHEQQLRLLGEILASLEVKNGTSNPPFPATIIPLHRADDKGSAAVSGRTKSQETAFPSVKEFPAVIPTPAQVPSLSSLVDWVESSSAKHLLLRFDPSRVKIRKLHLSQQKSDQEE